MIKKKCNSVLVIVLLLVFTCPLNSFASTVSVGFSQMLKDNELIGKNGSELHVLRVCESKNFFYLLIGYHSDDGVEIISIDKKTEKMDIFFKLSDEFKASGRSESLREIKTDGNGNLYAISNKFLYFFDNNGESLNINKIQNGIYEKLLNDGIYMCNSDLDKLLHWKGRELHEVCRFENKIMDFAVYQDNIFYLKTTGELMQYNRSGKDVEILDAKQFIPDKTFSNGQIISTEHGKLFLSACGVNRGSCFIDVQKQKLIPGMHALKINFKSHEDEERDVEIFLASDLLPLGMREFPMLLETNKLSIDKYGNVNLIWKKQGAWETFERKFMDSDKNIWRYNIRSKNDGIEKILKDGTSIYYSFVNKEDNEKEIKIVVDNISYNFDVMPYAKNNRVLIPLRGLSYLLGFYVTWNAGDRSVSMIKGNDEIILYPEKKTLFINGVKYAGDIESEYKNGRTMLSIRAISEAFGKKVEWDSEKNMVTVDTKM